MLNNEIFRYIRGTIYDVGSALGFPLVVVESLGRAVEAYILFP